MKKYFLAQNIPPELQTGKTKKEEGYRSPGREITNDNDYSPGTLHHNSRVVPVKQLFTFPA